MTKRVINVVSNADFGARGTCQKSELVSSLERMLAPASFPSTWSTDDSGCHSHRTLWLSLVRSTQMRTFPFSFGTTTMPANQSVGYFTVAITPSFSIRSSSRLTC